MLSHSSTDSVTRVLDDIRQSLDTGRLGHAYLISGPTRGAGGELATRMAQLVFCMEPGRPCGACSSCRRIAAGRHPDVTRTEPQSKGRQILIGEIRNLNVRISRTAYEGGWKVGIVLDADRMNPSAANAFLKTLEEPPPRTLVLLVSNESHALMPTLLSRCQRVAVQDEAGIPDTPWMPQLRELLAQGAPGSVIDALGRASDYTAIVEGVMTEIEADEQEAQSDSEEDEEVVKARISAKVKEVERALFRCILLWHRDVLVARSDPDSPVLLYHDQREAIQRQADSLTLHAAIQNVHTVEHTVHLRERNFRVRTALEQMMIEFGRSAKEKA